MTKTEAATAAAELLAQYSAQLVPVLERGGTHNLADVLDGFLAGKYTFFVNDKALVVAQINEYPRLREGFIFLAAGTLPGVEALCPQIRQWALTSGCSRVGFHGRRGWGRSFATKLGATTKWEVMEVDLGQQHNDE
jgi:hypothetical protein